jgi:hypothetical protein
LLHRVSSLTVDSSALGCFSVREPALMHAALVE